MKRIFIFFVLLFVITSISTYCGSNDILQRAVTLYKWKYYDDSITELNKLIMEGLDPWTGRAQFLKAFCLYKKGNIKAAEEIFRSLSGTPRFALYDYAKLALADMSFNNKDYEKAQELYKEIFSDSAVKVEADIKRAECLYETGKYDKAIEIYSMIIQDNPSSSMLDKARFNLGKCYERALMPKKAIKVYHEVNLYNPLSPLVKDCVSRINYLSAKFKIYPGAASAEDIFNKAMIFYNFGDFNSAGLFFQQIVSNYKGSELWEDALFKLAMCDYKRKRLRSAITRFKICAGRGGDIADSAQFYLAFAYGKAGYFYQVLDSLNKVMNNYPNSRYADDAAYYLGYFYEVNGFKDNALESYRKFISKYPKSEFTDDAYWKIGRMCYLSKDYSGAASIFKMALDNCQDSSMLDACAYWRAMSQEKTGNKLDAASSYQYVISKYDHSYYSYRAREKLASFGMEIKESPSKLTDLAYVPESYTYAADTPFTEEPLPFESYSEEDTYPMMFVNNVRITNLNEHFIKYSELMAVGFYEEAANEASILIDNSPPDKRTSAKLACASANLAAGKIRDSIIYAETLCNNSVLSGTSGQLPKLTWQLAYPKGYYKHVSQYASQFGLDEFLVFAVIREESRFNPKTVSWANARGLMQMIPQTGRNVARLIGIRPYYTNKLHDPEVNIKMGCYYLSQLMKRFDNNKVLALAAYNGGPLRVKRWMNKYSEIGSEVDMDEFIENIPLSETRRYVQKVIKSYYEYKRLYSIKLSVEG